MLINTLAQKHRKPPMKTNPTVAAALGIVAALALTLTSILTLNWWHYTAQVKAQTNTLDNIVNELNDTTPVSQKVNALKELQLQWADLAATDRKPETETHYQQLYGELRQQIIVDYTQNLSAHELPDPKSETDALKISLAANEIREELNRFKASADLLQDQTLTEKLRSEYQPQYEKLLSDYNQQILSHENEWRQKSLDDPKGSLQRVNNRDWPLVTYENEYFTYGPVSLGWAVYNGPNAGYTQSGIEGPQWTLDIRHPANKNCSSFGKSLVIIPADKETDPNRKPETISPSGLAFYNNIFGYGMPECNLHEHWKVEYIPK